MESLKALLPTPDLVVNAPLVDLAGYVLRALANELSTPHRQVTNAHNFTIGISEMYRQLGAGNHLDAAQACAEAWDWLYTQGLIGQRAGHDAGWFALTRKGKSAATQINFAQWVGDRELPETMLHEKLRSVALGLFRQGIFDTAVFEAFKTVEISIRDAAGLGHDLVGVPLASRAFHVEDGALTDTTQEKGERVALMNMMTGALGRYKNPNSHRRVDISAAEAREMLVIASHLLRTIDSQAQLRS